jgi:hypothetical protein
MAKLTDYLRLLKPRQKAEWSIGVYAGSSPFELAPHPLLRPLPVLTAASLGGIKAGGVADPFMMYHNHQWWMFFEVENWHSGRGEIGLASSSDGLAWNFEGIVLKEPFHLSYPHIFEFGGAYYMIPESRECGAVRLYKADVFPWRWTFQRELIHGDLADTTPFYYAGKWWIMALEGFKRNDALLIYFSDHLEGPWQAHAGNPILQNNRRIARPAGRVISYEGSLIRFTQDCEERYGRMVRAFRIEELSPTSYVEQAIGNVPILGASGQGWNASGMHHVDAHCLAPNAWIACVDGRRTTLRWPLLERLAARLHKMCRSP